MTPRRLTKALVLAAALGIVGCSSDASSGGSGGESASQRNLEVFSWWTSAGEKEALAALIDLFALEHPEVTVTNAAAVDPTTARNRLLIRLEANEPPDTFQAISGLDLLSWVEQGRMNDLERLAEEEGWAEAFPPSVLETVSTKGRLFAVPANIERDNNLYYGIATFASAGVSPPATLEEFHEVCAHFQAETELARPLALPAAGWVLALLAFENLLPSIKGADFYQDFFRGELDFDEDSLRFFAEELARVLSCSNVRTADPSWGQGADLLVEGKAAMFIMGDWAKGYLEGNRNAQGAERGPWLPGQDFGVVPGLGSAGLFTFNSAVFGLPIGAQNPEDTTEFLRTVGSVAGQEAFNRIKGSVPARLDVDLEPFDAMTRQAAEDFLAAADDDKLLPGYASLTSFGYQQEMNPSLLVFAVGGERARLLDPQNVPRAEAAVPPLDIDYLLGKLRVTYPLLRR